MKQLGRFQAVGGAFRQRSAISGFARKCRPSPESAQRCLKPREQQQCLTRARTCLGRCKPSRA
eukprot:10665998-Alexandrium_andersonii.AAC.1